MSQKNRTKAPYRSRFRVLIAGALLGLLGASCTLVEETGIPTGGAPRVEGGEGVVNLQLSLEHTLYALSKANSADTTFDLDSLIIVLTANGAATQTHSFAITGRADQGNIAVSPKNIVLPSLRTWKAKFISIDTTLNPTRRDTVHLDSVTFNVRAAETTFVAKTVKPVWSILRARFVSAFPDSIPNNVLFVRLKVNGVLRDSSVVGGSNASLNWLQAMPGSTIFSAGDSGKILRSTNNGSSWSEYKAPGGPNLVSGHFVSANNGWVVSRNGKIYRTLNGGDSWVDVVSGQVAGLLNGVFFTGNDDGFAVGDNGGIYKFGNTGNYYHNLVSNTAHHLNSVFFTSANVGYVVGENETILRTTNGNAPAGQLPQDGGPIWSPVAGGWFYQTSQTTSELRAVHFNTQQQGVAMGAGGVYRLTTDGGATWEVRSGVGSNDINGLWFTPGGAGFAVGSGGTFRKRDSEWWWAELHSSFAIPGGVNLLDIHLNGSDTGLMVGMGGALYRTLNASKTISDGGANRIVVSSVSSGTARNIRSVRFIAQGSQVAVMVGDTGLIRRSTDAGATWTTRAAGLTSRNLYEVRFASASVGYAVGDNGTILKTVDGGLNWSSQTSGVSSSLRSLGIVSADTVYATGVGGVVRKTVNGGSTAWYGQESPTTQTMNRLFFYNGSYGFAVGGNGVIMNAVNQGDNWTGGGVKRSLKGVYFVNANTGWIVGADGVILKTTNGGTVWAQQPSGVTTTLYGVHFRSTTLGWVTGEGGKILKTTNGGATWDPQTSGTNITLRWASFRDDNAGFVIGGTQSMYATANSGTNWNGSFVGVAGSKTFDQLLTYKYMKPGQSHTVLIEAIDRLSPLRGYQATRTVIVGAGVDSVMVSPMSRCGYGLPANPNCL